MATDRFGLTSKVVGELSSEILTVVDPVTEMTGSVQALVENETQLPVTKLG